MPISVNMFGLALTNDAHMRSKNGRPHHRTTGIASANPTQLKTPAPGRCISAPPDTMSPIVSRKTGAPSTTPIQKRRVMSTSSGFGASASAPRFVIIGSSAMPHFGHAPGLSLTTSGCMGHVYRVLGDLGPGAGGWRPDEGKGLRAEGKGEERLRPPICRTGVMGSRAPDKYLSGSALNF